MTFRSCSRGAAAQLCNAIRTRFLVARVSWLRKPYPNSFVAIQAHRKGIMLPHKTLHSQVLHSHPIATHPAAKTLGHCPALGVYSSTNAACHTG